MVEFDIYNFLKDFSPYLGVGIAYLAYKFEKNRDSDQREYQLSQKRINLTDSIILGISRVDLLLDNLKVDIEEKKYYAFKNIFLAQPLVERLKAVIDDVSVFSTEDIKSTIIKNTDLLSQLITDVNSIEQLNNSENERYTNAKNGMTYELGNFGMELIKMGLVLKNGIITGLSNREQDKKDYLESEYQRLLKKVDDNEAKKISADLFISEQRQALARKIIDVQTRMRELKQKLIDTKEALI